MRRRGLSLAEVLVAMAVMGVLSIALLNIFGLTMTSVRHGEGHLAMQMKAREAVRRLEPLLSTAIPPTTTQEAIYLPAVGGSGTSIRWSSTEDLFGTNAITPRAPHFYLYEINFAGGALTMRRIDPPGPDSRVLATNLDAASFEHLTLNTVRVQVQVSEQVRRAAGAHETLTQKLETLIQLPYYTSD